MLLKLREENQKLKKQIKGMEFIHNKNMKEVEKIVKESDKLKQQLKDSIPRKEVKEGIDNIIQVIDSDCLKLSPSNDYEEGIRLNLQGVKIQLEELKQRLQEKK